ncbi:hypothetical protein QR680_002152 [Steinernema hermaphroditum]|uniref:Potassium channel domain-containing protein n=1 Tax=Steinernema hermaphroditum TaxID=289476 RepID=A0AA39LH53_9BILA|nr:hypothetical protein QR680_002152 [Steinernema hermaphroditum]
MRLRRVAHIAACHLALYCFVILYLLAGAYVFYYIEGEREVERNGMYRNFIIDQREEFVYEMSKLKNITEIDTRLNLFLKEISALNISVERYLTLSDVERNVTRRWTFASSVLFSFTILTTIGYGNVAPTTYWCQMFTMVYGAFGIPLFLITIADLGRFFKTGIMSLIKAIYKKELKKQGERKLLREIGEVVLVAILFLAFIAAGSAVLPMWEHELSYFDSLYFSYIRMDFLFPTLIYITIGLWLTTALVEQLADVFRLVHYAGRQVSNVKGITVWLGGRQLTMGALIHTVCRRVGMSDNIIKQINWDRTIDQALAGTSPPSVPIFPWHFAEFVENDPPLIDLSVDDENMEGGSFYCSSLRNGVKRKLSAPTFINHDFKAYDQSTDGTDTDQMISYTS